MEDVYFGKNNLMGTFLVYKYSICRGPFAPGASKVNQKMFPGGSYRISCQLVNKGLQEKLAN